MLVSDICIALGLLSMACAAVLGVNEIVRFLQRALGTLVSAGQPPPKSGNGARPRKWHVAAAPRKSASLPSAKLSGAGTWFVLGAALFLLGILLRVVFAVRAAIEQWTGGAASTFSFSGLTLIALAVAVGVGALSWLLEGRLGKGAESTMRMVAIASLLVAILAFALDLQKALADEPPAPPPDIHAITAILPRTDRVAFSQLPSLPAFESGEARLTPALRDAICLLRQTARQPDSSAVVVVGRHDQSELLPVSRKRYGSNAGLAKQRASAVHEALLAAGTCSAAPLENVVSLHSGPNHMGSKVAFTDLAEDRQVQVFYLHRLP